MLIVKKIYILIALVSVILVGGFYALNSYIYKEKQGSQKNIMPYQATLTGEYVCLPHRDTRGPQTLECAFGIKTGSGEYYALDFGDPSQVVPNIRMGEKFTASGTVTPVEMLSTDTWKKYPIEGIFSVGGLIQED
jgi:hypothetical protein